MNRRVRFVNALYLALGLILLPMISRQKIHAQPPQEETPSLQQTLHRYIKDDRISAAILKVLTYAPANLRPQFEADLSRRIIDEAVAKHEGRSLSASLTTIWKVRDVYQMGLTTTGGPDGVRDLTAAVSVLWKGDNSIRNAIDTSSLDTGVGVFGADRLPEAKANAMLQDAVNSIEEPSKRRDIQLALNQMHPEVRYALVQLVRQFVRPSDMTYEATYDKTSVPMLASVLWPLSVQVIHPDLLAIHANANPFGDTMLPFIQIAAGAPRSVGPVGDALNVMTKFSQHYKEIDWRPVITQYARQGASHYLTENLSKMLAESVETTPTTAPSPQHLEQKPATQDGESARQKQ